MTQEQGGWPAQQTRNDNPGWAEYPANSGISASDPLPPAKAKAGEGKRLKLDSGRTIRLEMARIYKQMKSGDLEVTKGTKLIYALTELSRAMERETVAKLTERLDEVEGK